MFAAWPASPSAAQRRHLAALFLAAGEPSSAFVQWLRLPIADRHVGDGLDAAMVTRFATLMTRRDESFQIAAVLAARLGLDRVYPTDDHTADDDPVTNDTAYGPTVQRLWDNPATDKRKKDIGALEEQANTGAGVLAMYRAYNDPGLAQLIYDSDFGAALGVHPSLSIPFDAKLFGAAANNGQMILDANGKSKAADAFQTLAQIVSRRELPALSAPGKAASKSMFSGLFKKKT